MERGDASKTRSAKSEIGRNFKKFKIKISKLEKVSELGFKNDFGFRYSPAWAVGKNFEFLVRKRGE